jgi:hypothetical protein
MRLSGKLMKTTKKYPYWLYGGKEICTHCGQPYVYEMEVRCVDCDRGICPTCASSDPETAECFCPDCGPETIKE